jgi:hypothetical protein
MSFTFADLQHFRNLNPADFSRYRGKTRVWRFAEGESTAASPPGGLCPPPNARQVKIFHRLISHGIVKNPAVKNFHYANFMHTVGNPAVRFFHPLRSATVPLPNPADFSRYRGRTRVWRFAEGESTAALPPGGLRPPPNARNVKNFHRLISHGIVGNPAVKNFHYANFMHTVENSEVLFTHSLLFITLPKLEPR